jgi:hypothetical protein
MKTIRWKGVSMRSYLKSFCLNRYNLLVLFSLGLVPLTSSQLLADPVITVDENGSGTLDFTGSGGPKLPLVGVLAPDPGPGGLPAALTYNLLGPPALVAGDVFLIESVGSGISDVIRFNPANPVSRYPASLVFYSDAVPVDALADLGFPTAAYSNQKQLIEQGVEGNDGFFGYTPGPADPGYVPGFAVTYNFISDAGSTPEPTRVVGLLGIASMGLIGVVWRRRRTAA